MADSEAVTVRRASPGDAALLVDLGVTTFRATFAGDNTPEDMEAYLTENFTPARLEQELADPLATFFVAELSGRPVGYAKLYAGDADPSVTGPKPVELVRLYVLPRSIGHGIGARLVKECLGTAARRGFETVWLGVWEHNPRAIAFYRKWGFDEVGSHVFTLGTDAQTDLILQRSLREERD